LNGFSNAAPDIADPVYPPRTRDLQVASDPM